MGESHARTERTFLLVSVGGNLVIGGVGIAVSIISDSQAILLDGLFNLTYVAAGLFTLRVARLVQRGDDDRFPAGYVYFEPLVNGIKGVLVLGVSLMAAVGAAEALFQGGRAIAAGIAVGYGIFASLICWIMALALNIGCRRVDSPLLRVDAVNWIINAAISTCVLGAFVGIFLIQGTSLEGFVPYVDPSLVLIVIAISISAPVRMAWQALMELLNRTPSADVLREVRNEVEAGVADLPVQSLAVRVVQPGRTRMVWVHIVLPPSWSLDGLGPLDAIRTRLHDRLKRIYDTTALDVVFTADPRWGGVDVAGTAAVGSTVHKAVAQNPVARGSVDDQSVT